MPEGTSRYVALGDSYSAGEGLQPFDTDTDNHPLGDRCHRSSQAYPRRLLFSPETPALVEHRACSGAEIADLYDVVQDHDNLPVRLGKQADGQLGADVGLITLTIGGNDAGFSRVVKFCAFRPTCVNDTYEGHESLRAWADSALSELTIRLPELYRRLRQDAENARIVVLGYPKLFSEDPMIGGLCIVYEGLFNDDERRELNELGMRLNRVIETAALSVGLEYVELSYIFAGHETCSSAGPWLQFVNRNALFQDGNFHPEMDGQLMMARTVACYLTIVPGEVLASEDIAAVTLPDASLSAEEVQKPVAAGPSGDLGDALYACATENPTPADELDAADPPVAEVAPYPAPPATTTPSSPTAS